MILKSTLKSESNNKIENTKETEMIIVYLSFFFFLKKSKLSMYLQWYPREKLPRMRKTNIFSLFLTHLLCDICMREGTVLILKKVPFCQSFKQKRCKYSYLNAYSYILRC